MMQIVQPEAVKVEQSICKFMLLLFRYSISCEFTTGTLLGSGVWVEKVSSVKLVSWLPVKPTPSTPT